MSEIKLLPCPFCGVTPVADRNGISDFYSSSFGGFELRHACFENVRGNDLMARMLTIRGETKKEAADRWNRRRRDV